ncbi:kinase [Sphingomonas sp. LB-2]|uniref:kinase n=1 Tax=Sphingomonas caeni TaxID=2984949 RepID=UPI0022317E73|nr:kinase [Sphingomonas caeni]MCW3845681.1 kinase [Sphingomonas caeni]
MTYPTAADLIAAALPDRMDGRKPFILGICGAQGSGKSTVAMVLAERMHARGLRCAVLSLDDFYLDGARRQRLAETVHPLLRTRGVPGTHDVALWARTIEALGREDTVMLPRFDKKRDEPGDPEGFAGPADIVIFEGWCVGARPEPESALAEPVNALEHERDADGTWRRYVNDQLGGPYASLFRWIDFLVTLKAPGFDVVTGWRIEQERKAGGPMADAEVRGFVEHYRRLTEHLLRHGDTWADLTIRLDSKRRAIG